MAKKKKAAAETLNKSQAIRDYAKAHRNAMPKEIAEALTKQHGVEFTNVLVSTVLYELSKKKGKPAHVSNIKSKARTGKKKVGRRRRKSAPTGGELSTKLAAAISIVESAGGIDEAKKALGTIRKLEG